VIFLIELFSKFSFVPLEKTAMMLVIFLQIMENFSVRAFSAFLYINIYHFILPTTTKNGKKTE